MVFLLQIYAPIDDNLSSYHRMLYVFCCPNQSCMHTGKEITILRWQAGEDFKLISDTKKEKGKKKGYLIEVVSEESLVTNLYIERSKSIVLKSCNSIHSIEEQKAKVEIDDMEEKIFSVKEYEYETKLWKDYIAKQKENEKLSPEERELEQVFV